jgi:hypothetical protein
MQKSQSDSSLLLYQTEDGETRIEVRLLDERVRRKFNYPEFPDSSN